MNTSTASCKNGDPAGAGGDADRVAHAVLSCADVVELSGGMFGEVRAYLPGRSVAGVLADEDSVEVHVVVRYGTPLPDVAAQIAGALEPVLGGRALRVVVEDVAVPGGADITGRG
jgi:uncharacterized alkaline shock family protein YloU